MKAIKKQRFTPPVNAELGAAIGPDKSDRNYGESPAWCNEVLVKLGEAAGRPSFPQVILGQDLYTKMRYLARQGGMSTSDLVLAVLWVEIRDSIGLGDWFLEAARGVVARALKQKPSALDASPQKSPRANPRNSRIKWKGGVK